MGELRNSWPFEGDAVFSQLRELLFCGFMIPERSSWTYIEPCGIPTKPGLAESYERGALTRSILDEIEGFSEASSFVLLDGRRLCDRYSYSSGLRDCSLLFTLVRKKIFAREAGHWRRAPVRSDAQISVAVWHCAAALGRQSSLARGPF
jgi:hypothetical protein